MADIKHRRLSLILSQPTSHKPPSDSISIPETHRPLTPLYSRDRHFANLYFGSQQSAVYLLLSTTTSLPPCFSRSTLLNNLLHNQHMKHKCRHLRSAHTSVPSSKRKSINISSLHRHFAIAALVYTSRSHGKERNGALMLRLMS